VLPEKAMETIVVCIDIKIETVKREIINQNQL
jgi:hypothetical protein